MMKAEWHECVELSEDQYLQARNWYHVVVKSWKPSVVKPQNFDAIDSEKKKRKKIDAMKNLLIEKQALVELGESTEEIDARIAELKAS